MTKRIITLYFVNMEMFMGQNLMDLKWQDVFVCTGCRHTSGYNVDEFVVEVWNRGEKIIVSDILIDDRAKNYQR